MRIKLLTIPVFILGLVILTADLIACKELASYAVSEQVLKESFGLRIFGIHFFFWFVGASAVAILASGLYVLFDKIDTE